MVITEEYREQNKRLHKNPAFGFWPDSHKEESEQKARAVLSLGSDILDYGCGKKSLEKHLGFPIKNYDPALGPFEAEKAKVVACLDVLEHIEPDLLDAVLSDIQSLMMESGLFIVSTKQAGKTLPDGRNAHLIVQPSEWWIGKIGRYFRVISHETKKKNVWVFVKADPLNLRIGGRGCN